MAFRQPDHPSRSRQAHRSRKSHPDRRGARIVAIAAATLVAIGAAVAGGPSSSSAERSSGAIAGLASGGGPLDRPAEVLGNVARPSDASPRAPSPDRAPVTAPSHVTVPVCGYADEPAPHAGLADWASTLVDTAFALPADYAPPDLVPVGRANIPGGGLVRELVIDDLRALADAAKANGTPLAVQSAYRSRSRQAEVFAGWVASSGESAARQFSARPGHSEHQLGTALDLRAYGGSAPWSGTFGSTPAGRWLGEHASEYGFVLSYASGAEAVTCYGAEAWHIRYVGRERAAAVKASGLSLREWLWSRLGG